jgi:hypothetical protein
MGCFEDYLEFREGIEALRAEAKTKTHGIMKRECLSEERPTNAEEELKTDTPKRC